MKLLDKFLRLISNNLYIFAFSTLFAIVLLYSILVIFDLDNINPFLYFEF